MTAQTLLITLVGPQQAWGTSSRFSTRSTERAPSRSGVLGLVAAALGMERTAPLDRFHSLRFGVRIDRPGRIERDFQTARTLDGKTSMPLSQRFYLADALFLAGLESRDATLVHEIQAALRQPGYPLYLGRRAFPPAGPIRTELVAADLRTALTHAPWQGQRGRRGPDPSSVDLLLNAGPNEPVDFTHEDDPISFDPRRRQYGWRDVQIVQVTPPGLKPSLRSPQSHSVHDPMRLVSEKEV